MKYSVLYIRTIYSIVSVGHSPRGSAAALVQQMTTTDSQETKTEFFLNKEGNKKMTTYKEGKEIIEAIFSATAKGYENDAFLKCTYKLDSFMESGNMSYVVGNRLKNYLFDYKVLVTC